MTLDIAMGGSTNTVLHILAAAQEAGVNFTMADIDRLSRQVPCICKLAPASNKYHIEDCARAGGIATILGELDRAGKLHRNAMTVSGETMGEMLEKNDLRREQTDEFATRRSLAAPGNVRTKEAFSQSKQFDTADRDAINGCIRAAEFAYSQDGGLAVLYGNIAKEGCIVKTAGVDESIWVMEGPARIFESQEEACMAILGNKLKPGDVVVIRYEGPRGGPGMQEMLYPTSYIKSKHLGDQMCAVDRWTVQRWYQWLIDWARFARSGGRRRNCLDRRRRHYSHRHSQTDNRCGGNRRRVSKAAATDGSERPRRLQAAQAPTPGLGSIAILCCPHHQCGSRCGARYHPS